MSRIIYAIFSFYPLFIRKTLRTSISDNDKFLPLLKSSIFCRVKIFQDEQDQDGDGIPDDSDEKTILMDELRQTHL